MQSAVTQLPKHLLHLIDGYSPLPPLHDFRNIVVGPYDLQDVRGMCSDKHGNLFFADQGRAQILKLSKNGEFSVFAGLGVAGQDDGPATQATIGLSFDNEGQNLIILERSMYSTLRKITPGGIVSTITTSKPLCFCHQLCIDKNNNIYLSDSPNHRILKVTQDGQVETFLNNEMADVQFGHPCGLCFTRNGDLLFLDGFFKNVVRISPEKKLSVVADVKCWNPESILVDDFDNIFITDNGVLSHFSNTGERTQGLNPLNALC